MSTFECFPLFVHFLVPLFFFVWLDFHFHSTLITAISFYQQPSEQTYIVHCLYHYGRLFQLYILCVYSIEKKSNLETRLKQILKAVSKAFISSIILFILFFSLYWFISLFIIKHIYGNISDFTLFWISWGIQLPMLGFLIRLIYKEEIVYKIHIYIHIYVY